MVKKDGDIHVPHDLAAILKFQLTWSERLQAYHIQYFGGIVIPCTMLHGRKMNKFPLRKKAKLHDLSLATYHIISL